MTRVQELLEKLRKHGFDKNADQLEQIEKELGEEPEQPNWKEFRHGAICEATTRLIEIKDKIVEWKIVKKTFQDQEEYFNFEWRGNALNLNLREHQQIGELGYIVWKFKITEDELREAMGEKP